VTTIPTRFRIRRDTAANWTSTNPILLNAEPALETDTLKVKYGDGVTAWTSLGYAAAGVGTDLAVIEALTPSDDDFLQRKSGAWANRTIAQVKTDLGLGTAPLSVDIPSGSAVSLTSGTSVDLGYIDLPTGTWLVQGNVVYAPAAGTTMSALRGWISTTSATQPTTANGGAYCALAVTIPTGFGQALPTGAQIVTAAGTTRIYLSTRCSFSGGTMTAYGHMHAVRIT